MIAKKDRPEKVEKPEKKVKFEEAMEKLQGIVSDLEGGTLGLDDALERYEEGIQALKCCYAILQRAEKRIEVLTRRPDGGFETREIEGDGEEKGKKEKPSKPQGESGGLFTEGG